MGRVTISTMPGVNTAALSRLKGVHVTAAENGTSSMLDNINDYGQSFKIAKDASEVAEIISAYFG
jgi:hypothetical protein